MTAFNKTSARSSWPVAGAAAIAILACSAHAGSVVTQVTVRYDKLTDASHLYARLQAASKRVCRGYESKELRQLAEARACYNEALGNAVEKVGNTALSALHHASMGMRLAQRDANHQPRS